jgi:beta-xylosidase
MGNRSVLSWRLASASLVVTSFVASCSSKLAAPPTIPSELGSDESDAGVAVDAHADAKSPTAADAGDSGVTEVDPPEYANPVFAVDFPDPFVLRAGDRYYAYATNAAGKNVRTASSTDLATWTELSDALPVLGSWAKPHASLTWAPSVLRRGDQFVLYYTARDVASGFQCIGRAIAQSPLGPFVDETSSPFICQVTDPSALCGSIDASPFVDTNGDAYLIWKSDENAAACNGNSRLWTQQLGVDGISLLATPTELLVRDRAWEYPLIEGPSMLKAGGVYFLFYSANWYESASYGVGYATCATPVGPCEKRTLDGPLVGSIGETLGPGGQEFFTDTKGRTWMAYHAWSSPLVGYAQGGARSLRIDPIDFDGGVPKLSGPTTSARPL